MKPIGASFTHRWIAQLRQMHDYRIEGYLATIEFLNDVIIKSDVRIAEAVKNNHDALLLKSIPGVGDYTALIIASAIDGIERFRSSEKLSAYAGLVPSVRSSADTVHHGRITRRGDNIFRWILVECVYSHVRYAPHSDISMFYYRIKKRAEAARQQWPPPQGCCMSYGGCSRKKENLLQITVKIQVACYALRESLVVLTAK